MSLVPSLLSPTHFHWVNTATFQYAADTSGAELMKTRSSHFSGRITPSHIQGISVSPAFSRTCYSRHNKCSCPLSTAFSCNYSEPAWGGLQQDFYNQSPAALKVPCHHARLTEQRTVMLVTADIRVKDSLIKTEMKKLPSPATPSQSPGIC